MQKPEQDIVVIDGKAIKITKCPPSPIDPDLYFDRWSHDDAGRAPETERTKALVIGCNWQSGSKVTVMGKNGRVGPKKSR